MFKAKIYRRIKPVASGQYRGEFHELEGMTLHGETPEEVARDCKAFSLESNDSIDKVDKDLYFIIRAAQGISIAYGSPSKKDIIWKETYFV